jgi:hypothetical protein
VALGGEIIDLVRLHLLDDAYQIGGVREISVVEDEPGILLVKILIKVVDPAGVEERAPALDAVYLISLLKQQLRKIGSILTGDACNKCSFHVCMPPVFLNLYKMVYGICFSRKSLRNFGSVSCGSIAQILGDAKEAGQIEEKF